MAKKKKIKVAVSSDMVSGYYTSEKKNKEDFLKAKAKEASNLAKQFARGDKRNWY